MYALIKKRVKVISEMTKDEIYQQLIKANKKKANAEAAKIYADAEIYELELALKMNMVTGPLVPSHIKHFIDRNPDMSHETIVFLGNGEAQVKDAWKFVNTVTEPVSLDHFRRQIGTKYKTGPIDKPRKRTVCTISVVEAHGLNGTFCDGTTSTIQERGLHPDGDVS